MFLLVWLCCDFCRFCFGAGLSRLVSASAGSVVDWFGWCGTEVISAPMLVRQLCFFSVLRVYLVVLRGARCFGALLCFRLA